MLNKSEVLVSSTTAYGNEKVVLRNAKLLYFLMTVLLIADWVMPQYFGFHILFDITSTRFMNIIILLYFVFNHKAGNLFLKSMLDVQMTPYLALYMIVAIYTAVLRINVNSFFINFLDILTFYMVYYGIRYVIGVRNAIQYSVYAAGFFSIYGIIEYLLGYSPLLKYMLTLPNATKVLYRSGQYRVMGPCVHSIGYGMMLLFLIAIVCIDYDKDEMYLFKHPMIYILLMVNVFLTGSRGPLGLALVESALIVLFSKGKTRQKTLIILVMFLICFAVIEAAIIGTPLGRYIMMQITTLIDEVLGTEYSVYFGADAKLLSQSSDYRDLLPRIFTVDWLNPIVGRGANAAVGFIFDGVYMHSIDSYYIATYIRYGYPGMIAIILFFVMTAIFMLITGFKHRSGMAKVLAIALIMYCIGLLWADYLQTMKYMYIAVAIYAADYSTRFQRKKVKRVKG